VEDGIEEELVRNRVFLEKKTERWKN